MKRYALRLFVAFLTFCAGIAVVREVRLVNDLGVVEQVSTVIRIRTVDSNPAEANEVYNVILREKFPITREMKLLVLDRQLTAYVPYENGGMRKRLGHEGPFSNTIQALIPEAGTDTLNNYLAANRFGGSLTISAPDLNIAFANISDISSMEVGAFWSEFYKRYPNSYGI